MKCQYCGAEIKKGQTACEYCGSTVDAPVGEQADRHAKYSGRSETLRIVSGSIVKIIAVIAIAWVIIMLAGLVTILKSGILSPDYEWGHSESRPHSLPTAQTGLTGTVRSYDRQGNVSVYYDGQSFDNIKILDDELIAWLNETERTLERAEVLFDTDENGNISKIAMNSETFSILSIDADVYTACRGDQIIRFTSDVPLEMNLFYTGYFCYPNLHLASAKQVYPVNLTYMDPFCDEKKCVTKQDAYTGEDVDVYQIFSVGQWYYCSKKIYDSIQEGDSLEDYEYCGYPACIVER